VTRATPNHPPTAPKLGFGAGGWGWVCWRERGRHTQPDSAGARWGIVDVPKLRPWQHAKYLHHQKNRTREVVLLETLVDLLEAPGDRPRSVAGVPPINRQGPPAKRFAGCESKNNKRPGDTPATDLQVKRQTLNPKRPGLKKTQKASKRER